MPSPPRLSWRDGFRNDVPEAELRRAPDEKRFARSYPVMRLTGSYGASVPRR
jgi:hypothetical protein